MVQQAYIHRLALGRSAFEPPVQAAGNDQTEETVVEFQEPFLSEDGTTNSDYIQTFNSRGYPQNLESRSQVRRTIRAYNEVLATVDVCARVGDDGKHVVLPRKDSKSAVNILDDSSLEENDTGFWLSFADELIRLVTTTSTMNLRRRIQTFDFYSTIPLVTILKVEISRQGLFQVLFAGQFANSLCLIMFGIAENLIEEGSEKLVGWLINSKHGRIRRQGTFLAIKTTEHILKLGTFCALFPLQLYAGLQRLNLLPVWPLLPNPLSKPFFSIVFPQLPQVWNRRTMTVWSTALLMSPIVASMGMHLIADGLRGRLLHYSRSSMPRPDNPDQISYKMVADDVFDGSAPVWTYARFQSSLSTEIQKDVDLVYQRVTELRLQFRTTLRKLFYGKKPKRPTVEFPGLVENTSAAEPGSSSLPLVSEPALETTANDHNSSAAVVPESLVTAGSSNTRPGSPLLTPTSSEGNNDFDDGNTSNVRIRTRTGSTSTLHMDVEFTSLPRAGGSIHTSSFAASPHPMATMEATTTEPTSSPQHRVTSLSLHAADSLSIHIMTTILTLIRLPLEAYYTRTIARSYLSATDSPSWLIQHVYPTNRWCAVGISHANFDYANKILLCLGVETMITASVWRMVCKGALWAGKQWYGWGKL